jgi:hypothetical protein
VSNRVFETRHPDHLRSETIAFEKDQSMNCDLCSKLAKVHLTEVHGRTKTERHLCADHVPPELRGKIPFGSQRTPADEVEWLRKLQTAAERQISDPSQLAEFKAELERQIKDIEEGRRRLSDD